MGFVPGLRAPIEFREYPVQTLRRSLDQLSEVDLIDESRVQRGFDTRESVIRREAGHRLQEGVDGGDLQR